MEPPPFPPPPTKLEKAVVTTETRAVTLFSDGYEIHPENDRAGVYLVLTPLRTRGEQVYRHVYEVDLANGTCDCEMFQRAGTCKHHLACEKLVAKAVELAAPLLMARNAPALTQNATAGQQDRKKGYAALYSAPHLECVPPAESNLRAQNAYAERSASNRIETWGDGSQVDTVTGEVFPFIEPVRVLPVHGSEAWLRQRKDDFD